MMTTTMTVPLDDEMRRRLDTLAKMTDRSRAYLALQAIQEFLDANEWQVQAIQEAVAEADKASREDFFAPERVVGWLESWGTEDELDPPR